MGGVLCSVIASERIKKGKPLAIIYWQDTIFGVEINNVININILSEVSNGLILY